MTDRERARQARIHRFNARPTKRKALTIEALLDRHRLPDSIEEISSQS